MRARRIWRYQRELKAVFLERVRDRLKRDVGPYFALARRIYRETGQGVGFWALVRMIFPVIEGVAVVIFRSGTSRKPPVRLLQTLGMKYPNVAWEMYRHTLMHNEEMASASYRGRTVNWGIRLGGGHSWKKGQLHIDARTLYADFLQFLEREISSARKANSHVWVRKSFRFNSGFAKATRQEAWELGK
jgi:hypothetical protein